MTTGPDADLFGEPAPPAPEPEPAETPAEPDLFEAAVRLREALERVHWHPSGGAVVEVDPADLAAVLDAPGRHALTDEGVRRALEASTRFPNTRSIGNAERHMRACIAAALNHPKETP